MKSIIYVTITGLLLLSSCNQWLDVKPRQVIAEEEVFNTQDGFKDALTACYIKMNDKDLYGFTMTIGEMEYMAQHWNLPTGVTSGGLMDNIPLIKDYNYSTEYVQGVFADIYNSMYNVISQANLVLINIGKKGDVIESKQLRSVIEAEALGIRAFCHMDILRIFGQIPQNATKQVSLPYAETVSIAPIPYYTFEEFTAKILADIDKAIDLLKDSDPVLNHDPEFIPNDDFLLYRKFRINYYALHAMKARLYMYLGNETEANKSANLVISESGITMNNSMSDFNSAYYNQPSECILALGNPDIKVIFEKSMKPSDGFYMQVLQFKNDLFDPRNNAVHNRATMLWDTGEKTSLIKKYSQPVIYAKGIGSLTEIMTKFQTVPLIRISEMYLIAIETAASIQQANDLYKTYMAARGILIDTSLNNDQLLLEIAKEYRREFFAEGQMFYFYKRTKTETMVWGERAVTEDDYTVPLPKTEINPNK